MKKKIRNRVTGEEKFVDEKDLQKYGLGGKLKKANNGLLQGIDGKPYNFNQEDPQFNIGDEGYWENQGGMDNTSYSQDLRMRGQTFPDVKKGNVGLQPITQAPNYKQEIQAPQITPYDFNQTNTTNVQNNGQRPPAINPKINVFGGNKYFQKSSMYRNNAVKAFSSINNNSQETSGFGNNGNGMTNNGDMSAQANYNLNNPSFRGSKYGGRIMEFGGMNNGMNIASGVSNAMLADLNMAKGFVDVFGDMRLNQQTKAYENQQLRQYNISQFENMPQQFKADNQNPAYYETGGITNYKHYNQGGIANVELENNETVQTPEGLIDDVHGNTHAQGGIPMNLPENSKVFSEKLKHPDMKKSFAKLAKKFETKKDIDNLERPTSDKVNTLTSNLNIQLKNKLSDNLFQEQESFKLKGTFGKKIANETMKDYEMMEYGGLTQAGEGDVVKKSNGVFIEKNGKLVPINKAKNSEIGYDGVGTWKGDITGKINPSAPAPYQTGRGWNAMTHYKDLDEYAKAVGYTGKIDKKNPSKTSLEIQKFVGQKYPQLVDKYHTQYGQPFAGNPYDSKLGVRWESIADEIKGLKSPPAAITEPTPQTPDTVGAIDPLQNINTRNNSLRGRFPNINIGIPSNYSRMPLNYMPVQPEYTSPELVPLYLNDIQRQQYAANQGLGYSGSDISNKANIFSRGIAEEGKRRFDTNVTNANSIQHARDFNAQVKNNTNQYNSQAWFSQLEDPRRRREGAIGTQQLKDDNAVLQSMYTTNQADQTYDFVDKSYPWSNQTGLQYTMPGINQYNDYDKVQEFTDKNGNIIKVVKTTDNTKKFGGKVKKTPLKFKKK